MLNEDFLPHFKPPRTRKRFNSIVYRKLNSDECFSGPADQHYYVSGFEMDGLFSIKGEEGLRKEYNSWGVLETTLQGISEKDIYILVDLVTRRWEYVLLRTMALKQPVVPGKSTYPKTPCLNINNKQLQLIHNGILLLLKEKTFQVAIHRWSVSYIRTDPIDTVLDNCSSLEAALSLPNELRLRASLSVYHILRSRKKEGFREAYGMYGARNDFIHGKNPPKLTEQD